ncbi:MAG: FAD-binding protein, partial [Acidimicrobiales bacterium]
GEWQVVRARNVLLATGGAGQLYSVTTNPPEATGDGMAMALRAHVPVADVEFMQFHPTALHHPSMPRPLLSETLRGHGALLRDAAGERFVDELQSRDVVSRAMAARMAEQGVEHLWLDATGLEDFDGRFPTIAASMRAAGLDPSSEWLPVAPAAHYTIGGVLTDLDGASGMPGLWAAGESACSGVHGANRLGSNSLLEGMVFGARVVEAIVWGKRGSEPTGAMRDPGRPARPESAEDYGYRPLAAATGDPAKLRETLQEAMTLHAGVRRDARSLAEAAGALAAVAEVMPARGRDVLELRNLVGVADALVGSATAREESRGAHARTDFPTTSAAFAHRIVHR